MHAKVKATDAVTIASNVPGRSTLDLFRNSVNNSSLKQTSKVDSLDKASIQAEKKNRSFIKTQQKLELLKVANDEIAKKKLLVKDLMAKYPELPISADSIVRYEASEV